MLRQALLSNLRVAVALVCILLVLFVGAAQMLHQHVGGEAQNPACSLCVVAHLAATPAPAAHAAMIAEAVRLARPPTLQFAPARTFPFNLYVRPPPVLNAFA
jgi:disulfide bond formation protein DsbB